MKDERKYYEALLQYSQEHLMVRIELLNSGDVFPTFMHAALSVPPSRHADKGSSCDAICVLQQYDVWHHAKREELWLSPELHCSWLWVYGGFSFTRESLHVMCRSASPGHRKEPVHRLDESVSLKGRKYFFLYRWIILYPVRIVRIVLPLFCIFLGQVMGQLRFHGPRWS